ncbi:glycosyltransferase [Streptomyces sp. NPDC006510]|uniref:glycosyltransferase n=1 Tax=Streptomyces sp. NPDC006510 TaxID=3155600 RepID=UPI0033B6836E
MEPICIIPAYRVADTEIKSTFAQLEDIFSGFVVVLNDETLDLDRAEAVKELTGSAVWVASIKGPVGKGEAVRAGLRIALGESDSRIFVQMDGHLKQPPAQVARLVERVSSNPQVGMVVANRYGNRFDSLDSHRGAVTDGLSSLITRVTGYQIADTASGMRAYTRELASIFTEKSYCFGYGLELEQLFIAAQYGFSVVQESVDSNMQARSTAAEKIEDNLAALIGYAAKDLEPSERATLHRVMAGIKMRDSFEVDGGVFGIPGICCYNYIGRAEDDEESYSFSVKM